MSFRQSRWVTLHIHFLMQCLLSKLRSQNERPGEYKIAITGTKEQWQSFCICAFKTVKSAPHFSAVHTLLKLTHNSDISPAGHRLWIASTLFVYGVSSSISLLSSFHILGFLPLHFIHFIFALNSKFDVCIFWNSTSIARRNSLKAQGFVVLILHRIMKKTYKVPASNASMSHCRSLANNPVRF